MFKLHRWQEEMVRQLHEHWENREKPIQQILHERDLVHVGVDFGTKDQMVATRFKVEGDHIMVLDIETLDIKIRGKPARMILDDQTYYPGNIYAVRNPERSDNRVHSAGKIPDMAQRRNEKLLALQAHLRGERPVANASRKKKRSSR